jgi:hypothetical protein
MASNNRMNELERIRKKGLLPDLKNCPDICLERLRKISKTCQD